MSNEKEKSKLIRVILYYEDGSSSYLEYEEAEKWLSHGNANAVFAYTHGMNPFDTDPVKWKTTPPDSEGGPT